MRHRFVLLFSVLTAVAALVSGGCGPIPQLLYVERSVPAENPVDFGGKSVALFVSVDTTDYDRSEFISFNDSLHMVSMATGIASELERKFSLEEGAILVFNHYPMAKEREYDMGYIHNLSFASNSDLVFVLDSLAITLPKLVTDESAYESGYANRYAVANVISSLKLYDGYTADMLQNISRNDTIFWELLTRSDVREESIINRVNASLDSVTESLGADIAGTMFPSWREQERILYLFSGDKWWRAYDSATAFKWDDAMDVWLSITENEDDVVKTAAAAFNLSVASELTGRTSLALEWIDVSIENHVLKGAIEYKKYLLEKIEKE
jgi:predicted heme/steroid binding protein